MRKEANAEKTLHANVRNGQLLQLTKPIYYRAAYWLKDEEELNDAANCLLHNNLSCPRFQIGLRFPNVGSIILLNISSEYNVKEMQEFFTKIAVLYFDTINPDNSSPIMADIFRPRDLLNVVTVHLQPKDLSKLSDFALWFAACIQRSPFCALIKARYGDSLRDNGVLHEPMFCAWDMLNVSPMSVVKGMPTDHSTTPHGRWITRSLKRMTLYKCDRPIAEYMFAQ